MTGNMNKSQTKSVIVVESIEKANQRRQRERERAAWRRGNESPEQTLLRRQKERERAARRRQNENPLQTQLRLKRDRERAAHRRRNELPEETQLRLKRERERTALRRRRKIDCCLEKNDVCTNNTTQQFHLPLNNKDKKKIMAPFIQSELYEEKWSPVIGDISTASTSTTLSSSPMTDISSTLSAIDDNLLSARPKFFSVLSEYRCMLMSNLALFWKNGQYCDATLEAANSKILVHKLILLAISPKLQFKVKVPCNSFMRVIFPHGVNEAGLEAFADYMYNGILSLDSNCLLQLRIIAQQLDIEELGLLCQNQLLSSNTKPNIQQTDSLIPNSTSPSISILFEENFVKKELSLDESSGRFTDKASELVSIHQNFPSEKAVNHLHGCLEENHLKSTNIQNFQATDDHFEKRHPILSQTLAQCPSALINEAQTKSCDSFVSN